MPRSLILVVAVFSCLASPVFAEDSFAGRVDAFLAGLTTGELASFVRTVGDTAPGDSRFDDMRDFFEANDCVSIQGRAYEVEQIDSAHARILVDLEGSMRPRWGPGGPVPLPHYWIIDLKGPGDSAIDVVGRSEFVLARQALAEPSCPVDAIAGAHQPVAPMSIVRNMATLARWNALADADAWKFIVEFSRTHGNLSDQALCLEMKAHAERFDGMPAEAMKSANEGLELARSANDIDGVARGLFSLGEAQWGMGELEAAYQSLDAGGSMIDRLTDPRIALQSLLMLAYVHQLHGDYRAVLEAAAREGSLAATHDWPEGVAVSAFQMGEIHSALRHYEAARQQYQRALEVSSSSAAGRLDAYALAGLAECDEAAGEPARALSELRRAAAAAVHSVDTANISIVEASLGNALTRAGQFDEAEVCLQDALHRARVAGQGRLEARALLELSGLRLAEKLPQEALAFMNQAREAKGRPDVMALQWSEWPIDAAAARALKAVGRNGEARARFEDAIDTIEMEREEVPVDAIEREQFLRDKVSPFRDLAEMLIEEGKNREALEFAERSKGRALLDILRGGVALSERPMSREDREKERELESAVAALKEQKRLGNGTGTVDQHLAQAKTDLELFRESSYARDPRLRAEQEPPPTVTAAQLSGLLPDTSAAFVEYLVTDSALQIFIVRRGGRDREVQISIQTVPIAKGELSSTVADFATAISKRDLRYRPLAERLYRLLLGPAEESLQGVKTLCIIPDGPLWRIPFEALVRPDGDFVVQHAACFYAPSISVYAQMSRNGRKASGERRQFIGFADPAGAGISVALDDGVLPRLPQAMHEVEVISSLFPSGTSLLYTGAAASEGRAKSETGEYSVVHFATHAVIDDQDPMYSELMLAPSSDGDDGHLETWEMMKLDLRADLVVLSACETARGGIHEGEGLVSMSWALFMAGCSSTIVTQWGIPSATTATLMIDFYREWIPNRGSPFAKAEALRRARLGVMKDGRHHHPFYWSAPVLIGSGS